MQQARRLLHASKPYLLLLGVACVAFWPVALHVYSLKNDALVYFLPYRYHVSESIQHGYFPWWSPYLYTGLPLHSDIQSGVWNPVVMLISLFTTYDMSVLQWELLLYIVIAGAGMYKLVKGFSFSSTTAFIAATAYMCSGFITDTGSMIPWITSAAYLPFVLLYFYRLKQRPVASIALKLALSMALLLTAGYPSFFIYTCYVLFAASIVLLVRNRNVSWRKWLLMITFAAVAFLLLCGPVLLSWWDFSHYYDRGSGASLGSSLSNSFTPFSNISYIFPSAVSRDHQLLNTDLSERNGSIGIFIFLLFLLACLVKLKPVQRFILGVVLFSFLFSLGAATPLRAWAHRLLPLMDTFRHPGSMRLFTSLGMILLACTFIEPLLAGTAGVLRKMRWLVAAAGLFIVCMMIYYWGQSNPGSLVAGGLDVNILNRTSFADMILLQGSFQLVFLAIYSFLLWKKLYKHLAGLFIINSMIFCWMALPFTLISKVHTRTVDRYVHSFPKSYPVPGADKPVYGAPDADFIQQSSYGYDNFYNKTVRIQDHVITPTITTNYSTFLRDARLREIVRNYSLMYFPDTIITAPFDNVYTGKAVLVDSTHGSNPIQQSRNSVRIVRFTPNQIAFETMTDSSRLLSIFQQYHHGWQAFTDGKQVKLDRVNHSFLGVQVPGGKHITYLTFHPRSGIVIMAYTSLAAILLILIFFIFRFVKNDRS